MRNESEGAKAAHTTGNKRHVHVHEMLLSLANSVGLSSWYGLLIWTVNFYTCNLTFALDNIKSMHHANFCSQGPGPWSLVLTSSSRSKCSLNLPIPMVILGIPHPVHTFNSQFPSHFSLESRIPAFTEGICLKDKDNANPGSRKTQVFGNPYMSPVDRPGVVVTGLSRLCFHCVHIHCLYGLLWNLHP